MTSDPACCHCHGEMGVVGVEGVGEGVGATGCCYHCCPSWCW